MREATEAVLKIERDWITQGIDVDCQGRLRKNPWVSWVSGTILFVSNMMLVQTKYRKGHLCRSDILTEFVTAIKASPQIVQLHISSLASAIHHSLNCRKRASMLKPVLDKIFDLIQ